MNLHMGAENILVMKINNFEDTRFERIHGGKHSFILQVIRSIKKFIDFINGKYDRELVLYHHAWSGDIIPQNVKYIPIEKRMAE